MSRIAPLDIIEVTLLPESIDFSTLVNNMNTDATNDTDFDTYTIKDLKRYLRDHGELVTGKKAELVQRAKGVLLVGKRPLSEINASDEQDNQNRRTQKFVSPLGEKLPDPDKLKKTEWETTVTDIPNFRKADLYNYLVLSKQATVDMDKNCAKRQLKAGVFYEDRHVHSVTYHPISKDCSHCFVKCNVIPSLPTQDKNQKPDYNVWVCLSKMSGRVHAAGCSCSAGEGESCNHIAALLYALVDISHQKEDGLDASTSQEQKWGKPRKRKMSPKKSQDLKFSKYKWTDLKNSQDTDQQTVKNSTTTTDYNRSSELKVQPVNTKSFAEKLKKCAPHAAWLLSVEKKDCTIPSVPWSPLHQIDFMFSDKTDLKSEQARTHFKNYFASLSVSEKDCVQIEQNTRGQVGNKNWTRAKYGRLTSSNFGLLSKRKETTEPDNILKTIMGYKRVDCASLRWGRTHEPAARRFYTKHLKSSQSSCHGDSVKVAPCGLFVNSMYPHLGASPDGVVTCASGRGLVEIKCPYKSRNMTPQAASKDPDFCCEISESGHVSVKKHHNYYYQVQGQLAITKRSWCDFFIWTLQGYSVERIYFDKVFWENCLTRLNDFYLKGVLPELFTCRVKRGKKLYD